MSGEIYTLYENSMRSMLRARTLDKMTHMKTSFRMWPSTESSVMVMALAIMCGFSDTENFILGGQDDKCHSPR